VRESDNVDELVKQCGARVRNAFGNGLPHLALVLGSGFQPVLQSFQVHQELEFARLPGFPKLCVKGHAGRLLLAELAGIRMLVCSGRAHFYEGHSMEAVIFPTRVLAECGVKELLLTNAAGGINARFHPGDFMLFSDHINLAGINPLRGLPIEGGRCFVDLSEAYSLYLRKELKRAALKAGVRLHDGIYIGVSGPSYETPAEIRAFRKLGADAVGMSTIPEVLMARYFGMEVAAISCITNAAAGIGNRKLSHREVLQTGEKSAEKAGRLLTYFAQDRLRKAEKWKQATQERI
jgi:purine-nucleoside phosphorylase